MKKPSSEGETPLRFMIVDRCHRRAGSVLRAGWILTSITAAMGLALAGVVVLSPGSEVWTTSAVRTLLEMAVWTYVPPLLLLSVLAICRGAPRRGLLLLIGSPLLLHGMDLVLAGSVSGWTAGARWEEQGTPLAAQEGEPIRSTAPRAPFLAGLTAPEKVAGGNSDHQ